MPHSYRPEGTILARVPMRENLSLRLTTLLAATGYFSRKQLKHAKPRVNGTVWNSARALSWSTERAWEIEFEDIRLIAERDDAWLLAMHKPVGVVCAHPRPGIDDDALTVFDLLPSWLHAELLEPIGRLDKDTSGLLLLSEDGALNQRMRHPSRAIARSYEASLARPLAESAAQAALDEGVVLRDGARVQPSALRRVGEAPERWEVTVTEGKYHEVRRLFAALGSHVDALHRRAYHRIALAGDQPLRLEHADAPIAQRAEPTAEDESQSAEAQAAASRDAVIRVDAPLTRIRGAVLQALLADFNLDASPQLVQLRQLDDREGSRA